MLKILNKPKKIYLNLGIKESDAIIQLDFEKLKEVSWSTKKIEDLDIGYIEERSYFPNGFNQWIKVLFFMKEELLKYFQIITEEITENYKKLSKEELEDKEKIFSFLNSNLRLELFEYLAAHLTTRFEKEHLNGEWDGDFVKRVPEFIKEVLETS